MLSGETANGLFPSAAVATMAALAQNAEQIVDKHQRCAVVMPIAGRELMHCCCSHKGSVNSVSTHLWQILQVPQHVMSSYIYVAIYKPASPRRCGDC